jgi:serine/threonine-protein kinase
VLKSLVWVDRDGVEEPLPFPPRDFTNVGLSRDDRRLAITVDDQGNEDIWIYDLAGETSPIRLTFGAGEESNAVWMPGDVSVVYSLDGDEGGMFWKAADGTGRETRLTESPGLHRPETFAPNGQLIYRQEPILGITGDTATDGATDLHILTIDDEDVVIEALRQTQFAEAHPTVSPNGRFITYESNETGSGQVIVRPFPIVEEDERWQISKEVGGEPRWGPFGDELFFVDYNNNTLMVTRVETETSFSYGTPTPLFDSSEYRLSVNSPTYAISSDGQRFLMMKRGVAASDTTLGVIDNWFEVIRRREAAQ